MTQLTPHFALSELRCRCGCSAEPALVASLARVAQALEQLRAAIGRPVQVISGHRCPKRNRQVGGSPRSQHMAGTAVDVQVEGMTGVQLRQVVERLIAEGLVPDGGIGTYADRPWTLHYDQRTVRARWP